MKHCDYCGKDYADEFEFCPTDSTPLKKLNEPQIVSPGPIIRSKIQPISPEEQHFWERMTFRGFAIFWIRLEALWLFFYALLGALNMVADFSRLTTIPTFSQKLGILLELLRIILHVAAGFALIVYAEPVMSWLVKDLVAKPPSNDQQ